MEAGHSSMRPRSGRFSSFDHDRGQGDGAREMLEARVGIEPLERFILRKLLILRCNKIEKNIRNVEPQYTAGARNSIKEFVPFRSRQLVASLQAGN
jgi:hypothetical protein